MRHATAVRRLRQIAADCRKVNLMCEEPLLLAAYAFGSVLDGQTIFPPSTWRSCWTLRPVS